MENEYTILKGFRWCYCSTGLVFLAWKMENPCNWKASKLGFPASNTYLYHALRWVRLTLRLESWLFRKSYYIHVIWKIILAHGKVSGFRELFLCLWISLMVEFDITVGCFSVLCGRRFCVSFEMFLYDSYFCKSFHSHFVCLSFGRSLTFP